VSGFRWTHDNVATTPHRARRLLGRVLWLLSACIIALLTLTPAPRGTEINGFCIVCGAAGGTDAVLNVLLFVPLGVGLALDELKPGVAIAAMCLASIGIELLQLNVIPNRDATISDVVMNSAGGMIGFVIGRRFDRLAWPDARLASRLALVWAVAWLALQILSAVAYVPAPPRTRFYGQIARDNSVPRFDGIVVHPTLDGRPIHDWALDDSEILRRALRRAEGAVFEATVVAHACSHGVAPIVRIAAVGDAAVVNVSQVGPDFAYGIRTVAEVLKLRRMRFRLANVFRAACAQPVVFDTVVLRAAYARSSAQLAARTRSGARRLVCRPRLSQGWRLVMPTQTYADCSPLDALLGAAWMALLLLPGAYWIARARAGGRDHAAMTPIAAGTLVLVAGVVLVPMLLRLPPTPWQDWLGMVCGAIGGATLVPWLDSVGGHVTRR